MTEIIQIAVYITFILFSVILCAYIAFGIKKSAAERKHITAMKYTALSLKNSIETTNRAAELAVEIIKSLHIYLDLDETTIKSRVERDNDSEYYLYLSSDCYSSLNDLIAKNNGLSRTISSTRTISENIISYLDNISLRNAKRADEVREILKLAEISCDNADNVLEEAYLLVDKSRVFLNTFRKCALELKNNK